MAKTTRTPRSSMPAEKEVEETKNDRGAVADDSALPADIDTEDTEDSIDIIKNKNIFVRQYSRAVHGDGFKDFANEFVQKKNNTKGTNVYEAIDSSKIGAVEVRYREKEDAELNLDKQKPDAPMVDKVKRFEAGEKNDAISFSVSKFGATVVVSKKK